MPEEVKKTHYKRVDILVEKGTEELLPEETYAFLSNSGIWIEEKGEDVVIKSYPEDIDGYLNHLWGLKIGIKQINVEKEEQQDYGDLTKKYFRPIKIDDITIMAPWNKQKGQGIHIVIEPGMAFGTGRHESTRIMMKLMKQADVKGKKVLDIGCGSGILSLYAALLGAKSITAIDNDPDAIFSAKKNVSLNNTDRIMLACTDIQDVSGTYDIVLANLDIRTFTLFSEKIKGLVKKDGYIVISGILGKDRKRALALFHPFIPIYAERKNAWCGFVFKARKALSATP